MNIKYTKGTITPIQGTKYADLILYNGAVAVYKATIPMNEVEVIITMHKNIIQK